MDSTGVFTGALRFAPLVRSLLISITAILRMSAEKQIPNTDSE